MTASCYMTITDKNNQVYKGSSIAKDHEGTIEIFDWSFSVSQTETASMENTAKKGKSTSKPSEFSFSKFYDLSSDDLLSACWQGLKLKECKVEVYRSIYSMTETNVAPKDKWSLCFILKNAYIVSLNIDENGEEIPKEKISIDFEEIEFTYKEDRVNNLGKRQITNVPMKFSWQENKVK
jgi:type VI secretion system Hcp family effector